MLTNTFALWSLISKTVTQSAPQKGRLSQIKHKKEKVSTVKTPDFQSKNSKEGGEPTSQYKTSKKYNQVYPPS